MAKPPREPRPSATAGEFLRKMSPLSALIDPPKVDIPIFGLPHIEEVAITVPAPSPLGASAVEELVVQRARQKAPKRERPRLEKIELGDEICIDQMVTQGPSLIPWMTLFDDWRELRPFPGFPGVAEALSNLGLVGQCVQIGVTVPDDFVIEFCRGKQANFTIGIHRAFEVQLPSTRVADLVSVAGLGKSLADATRLLNEERVAQARGVSAIDRLITAELARYVTWEVPPALVDFEILTRWADAIGRKAVEKKFSDEQQRELLAHWTELAPLRAEVTQKLKGTIALTRLGQRDGVGYDPARMLELFTRPSKELGLTPEKVQSGLNALAPDQLRRMRELAAFEAVLEYARSKVKITYEQPAKA